MGKQTQANQRFFSVELKSKADIKNLTLTNHASDGVLIEGSLGMLVTASFEEGVVLEVVGTEGTLRLNLAESEIQKGKPEAPVEVK